MFILKPLFEINYKLLVSISIKHKSYKYFNNNRGSKSRFYKYIYNNATFYYNEKVNEICDSKGFRLGLPDLLHLGFTEKQIIC